MVIFLNWWVSRSSCFNTIYRHIQCIQWKLYQTEIFLFNIFLRNKRFRKQMWRIQAGGCFWRKPRGWCCNGNLLFTIFQFPSWEWGFQKCGLTKCRRELGTVSLWNWPPILFYFLLECEYSFEVGHDILSSEKKQINPTFWCSSREKKLSFKQMVWI